MSDTATQSRDVVVVHEWLTNYAGSERVVSALRACFPGSPVLTTMCWGEPFQSWDVRTSFLQIAANGPSSHVSVLPALPVAMASLTVPPAELVITSFHSFSLHARVADGVPHVVYCHTPPRFLWRTDQFPLRWRAAANAVAAPLRRWDRRRADRRLEFVANSRATADRVRHAYGIPSTVVHPPVDIDRYAAARSMPRGDYFLVLSRLVPYKRIDLAIEAFNLLGLPLVVAGTGRAEPRLRAIAGPTVRFVGYVADEDLPALVARARGFVFPGEEDFGITMVEALAAGTPVVAFARGGALDFIDERNGVLFSQQTTAAIAAAVREVAKREWNPDDVSATVAEFGQPRFVAEIRDIAGAVCP